MARLDGKVSIITGAGSGMGEGKSREKEKNVVQGTQKVL